MRNGWRSMSRSSASVEDFEAVCTSLVLCWWLIYLMSGKSPFSHKMKNRKKYEIWRQNIASVHFSYTFCLLFIEMTFVFGFSNASCCDYVISGCSWKMRELHEMIEKWSALEFEYFCDVHALWYFHFPWNIYICESRIEDGNRKRSPMKWEWARNLIIFVDENRSWQEETEREI